MAELNDELGKVGFVRTDARGFKRAVEADLLGSHRFNLENLGGARRNLLFRGDCVLREADDDLASLFRVTRPVNDAARTCAVLLELFEVGVQMRHGVFADALASKAKLLPVG